MLIPREAYDVVSAGVIRFVSFGRLKAGPLDYAVSLKAITLLTTQSARDEMTKISFRERCMCSLLVLSTGI